ncbi:hypothetical protein PG993_007515 [Apiospora rasikravindrae]|uniref:Uncharacterized protein n=1 Tax=Apiospora rasikravindrae TaxID=990691 RepID=A0ABR1SXP7_9PEZI
MANITKQHMCGPYIHTMSSIGLHVPAAQCFATEPEDPFGLGLDQVQETMTVNAISVYAAAREAVKGFEKTGPGITFIMTGNKLNTVALPGVLCFGMDKSAAAHMIQNASNSYKKKGYK